VTPLRSRYVSVHLDSVGDLPAVVESEDEGTIVVSLAVRRPPGFERALGRPVGLQCVSARGIQRVTGAAKWDAARPDELRIARDTSKVIQRRDAVRVDAAVPALLIVEQGDAVRATTTTVNVSTTGLLVRDPLELAPGTPVRLELELEAGGPPLALDGQIVREAGPGAKGVHFDAVDNRGQQRLARFIFDRQRAALRTVSAR
jgi:PilZ domain